MNNEISKEDINNENKDKNNRSKRFFRKTSRETKNKSILSYIIIFVIVIIIILIVVIIGILIKCNSQEEIKYSTQNNFDSVDNKNSESYDFWNWVIIMVL